LILFPDAPFLLLVVFVMILLMSEIIQRCTSPFSTKYDDRFKNEWFHNTKLDAILQVCLVVITGLGFLALASKGLTTSSKDTILDVLLLSVFCMGFVYWIAAIRFSSAATCLICPQFNTSASACTTNNDQSEDTSLPDNEHEEGPDSRQDVSKTRMTAPILHKLSMLPQAGSKEYDEYDSEDANDRPRSVVMDEESLAEWKQTSDYDEWAAVKSSVIQSDIVSKRGLSETAPPKPLSMIRSPAFRDDSTIVSTLDGNLDDFQEDFPEQEEEEDEDMATITEEIWIDENTGKEVDDRSQPWTDSRTGMRVT
jgi:hypothetical protein